MMMAPVDESSTDTPQQQQEHATDGMDNQLEHMPSRDRRERGQSEATRRDDRESQRAAQREEKTRLAMLNNRFLAPKESRATSSDVRRESDSPSRSGQKKKSGRQPEDDDNGGLLEGNDDERPTPRRVEEKALVVTRRRSSAASSATENDKARTMRDGSGGWGRARLSYDRAVVMTPSLHVIPSLALRRSKWTRELDEDAACGLYVENERRELEHIASSTLVRLEERLQRETGKADQQKTSPTTSGIRLNDLLHVPHAHDTAGVGVCDISKPRTDGHNATPKRRRHAWTLAALEITIDRLELDDHISFSLADRIETQLRSLYVSYTHLLHAQPWGPLLERVDVFVDACLLHKATDSHTWLAQTQLDAQALLQSLGTLQQLHYQLLIKWNELQDCYRQATPSPRTAKLRVRQEKRATSLTVTSIRAFLELELGDDDGEQNRSRRKLEKRLEELETKDQYLYTVLILEMVDADTLAHTTPIRGRGLRSLSCWPSRMPSFYAALFINGKEVGRTKASSWSSHPHSGKRQVGVVPIHETLRTQLHFFPDAVTIKVLERGLVTDTLLSTTSIPLLVPGHDCVGCGSLKEPKNRVAAASLAATVEWYQFSSVNAMDQARWHATFLSSSLFTTFQRHPHGRVRVRVGWVAPLLAHHEDQRDDEDEDNTRVVLPPRRLPLASRHDMKLVGPRVDRRRLYTSLEKEEQLGSRSGRDPRHTGFSYERDFLVHVTDVSRDPQLAAVDRNDPQYSAIVRLQDHVHAQSALLKDRDVFRATSLIYDAMLRQSFDSGHALLTRRNFLLQLRDREHVAIHGTSTALANELTGTKNWTHAAFDEPLPLTDTAIATNVKYLSLLRPEIPAFDRRQQLDDALAIDGDGTSRFSVDRERKLQVLKLQNFLERVRSSQVARVHSNAFASAGVKQRDRTKTLVTIVQEQPMPLLPGAIDWSSLGSLFSRRRRLRPRVATRTAPKSVADWPRHCMLYVQIKSATNVPVRLATGRRGGGVATQPKGSKPGRDAEKRRGGDVILDGDDDDSRGHRASESPAAPAVAVDSSNVFVEISFQGRRRRTTSTQVGTTGAVWMETVALPFHAPHEDWSPDSLQRCPDIVRLTLYDQLLRTSSSTGSDDAFLVLSHDGSSDDHTQQRVQSFHQENRFLGSLEIPFTTLFHNHGSLDATLRCEMPMMNIGYRNANCHPEGEDERDQEAAATSVGADRDDDGVVQSSREATFLSVMMTLDPLLPLPVKSHEENPLGAGDDSAALGAYVTHWKTTTHNMNAATQHRKFDVFARSLDHGQTFLTRFVAPQRPPPIPLDASSSRTKQQQLTVPQLVRFVHLIPFLDDWQVFDKDGSGKLDVWTTSQELLELNAGDLEEHAVLLCNYLNWLDRDEANRQSFLVVATATPEGKTVYVLRQDSYKIPQRSVLWNASTGVGYSVLDDRCPVLDVSLVVSCENIYANIQPRKRLSEMHWDVETNPKAWRPFFQGSYKKDPSMLPTVQSAQLIYADTPSDYVQQVETELREALKLEIRRWRSVKYTTTINMDLSMKLRSQLERLELRLLLRRRGSDETKTIGNTTAKDLIQELQKTRRVSGMPLNTTFTDITKVVSMVKNTNIYWNDHAEVEFGLAVYVHPYPNNILSVWVYLVAVEPME